MGSVPYMFTKEEGELSFKHKTKNINSFSLVKTEDGGCILASFPDLIYWFQYYVQENGLGPTLVAPQIWYPGLPHMVFTI